AAAVGGFWFGQKHPAEPEHETENKTASTQPVTLAAVKIAPISRAIVAYGAVVAQPGNVRILSAAFEARVDNVRVAAGHPECADADVIEIEPSLDAVVGIAEAKNSLAAAQRDLKQTEQRFADHLATNSELSQAQQTLQSAQLKLDSLVQRGAGAGS